MARVCQEEARAKRRAARIVFTSFLGRWRWWLLGVATIKIGVAISFLAFLGSRRKKCGEKSHQRGFDVATQQCINRLSEVWKDYNWSWDKELLERVFFSIMLENQD